MTNFIQFLVESSDLPDLPEPNEAYSFRYHHKLNSRIWVDDDTLKPEILKKLRVIAREYYQFLDIKEYKIDDVIFTGSVANYNYTAFSDIDLHIILDVTSEEQASSTIDFADFLDTKKKLWGEEHNIQIYGYPVELYAQLKDEVLTASGVYSVTNEKWNLKPKKLKGMEDKIDQYAINIKAKAIKREIDELADTHSGNIGDIKALKAKIKDMRQSGLKKAGEFSVENLVFKNLRNTGYLEKLQDLNLNAFDKALSLY
jgi:predicted nucleotidyltransferase